MTLKEQIERERMYREALRQMEQDQLELLKPLARQIDGLFLPEKPEPDYRTVKAELK